MLGVSYGYLYRLAYCVGSHSGLLVSDANGRLPNCLTDIVEGYQMSMSNYAGKIDVLLAKMFALKPLVLPANRNSVEEYLRYVWKHVTTLTAAFRKVDVDAQLLHKFEDYTQAEESRLLENLKTTKFVIDAQNTLDLIRGPGGIEKVVPSNLSMNDTHHVVPVLYTAHLPSALSPPKARLRDRAHGAYSVLTCR